MKPMLLSLLRFLLASCSSLHWRSVPRPCPLLATQNFVHQAQLTMNRVSPGGALCP